MAITEVQRKNRKNHLGSSDIPALMGFSRFATPYDIWLQKTGRIPDDPNDTPTDYQETGNILEEGVIKWAQGKGYILDVEPDVELAVPDTPIVVHTDGIETITGVPVEVKTEGLFGPIRSVWGESGTTEVPEYTCIQAHTHMMAADKALCHVPTFLGGRGFGYYYVERDEQLVALIREQSIRFWEDCVVKDCPPPDSVPSLSLIKKIRRMAGDPVALADELVQVWIDAKETALAADEAKKQAQAAILAALDGLPEGTCNLGLITNYMQSRKETIQSAAAFPVLRLKKAK